MSHHLSTDGRYVIPFGHLVVLAVLEFGVPVSGSAASSRRETWLDARRGSDSPSLCRTRLGPSAVSERRRVEGCCGSSRVNPASGLPASHPDRTCPMSKASRRPVLLPRNWSGWFSCIGGRHGLLFQLCSWRLARTGLGFQVPANGKCRGWPDSGLFPFQNTSATRR